MTPNHSTGQADTRTDPFRWDGQSVARAFDHFQDPDHTSSQRQYADEHGVPRSTLGYWLRQEDPEGVEADLVAFLRSSTGRAFLRRLVLAVFLVFVFQGACGLRRVGRFLRLTHLDRFVAPSHGALHELSQTIEADLAAFADAERARLAPDMPRKDIALVPDENFHGKEPCLVAIEPAANFLLVEQYSERRDADTWTSVLGQATADLPVTVRILSSDRAKGLIACAENGLQVPHLPELFHGQRDLCRPLMGPLQRHQEAAEHKAEQAQDLAQYWRDEKEKAEAAPPRPGRKMDFSWRIASWECEAERHQEEVKACAALREQARQGVRGIADEYHPFDPRTGAPRRAEAMAGRLEERMKEVEKGVEEGELGEKAEQAVKRGRSWMAELVGALAWFWTVAGARVEELDLPEEAERVVEERLLGGLYWERAARRERTAEGRQEKKELADRLLKEAWLAEGPLSRLGSEKGEEVKRVCREVVGLFARSSSCVEGRNGRLSLFHHGQCRLSASRLKALTAVHNYVSERADGTTAAERFFGQKPRDAFDWLLQRLPELPRPAAKRPRKDPEAASKPG